jgi:hypothetical protein
MCCDENIKKLIVDSKRRTVATDNVNDFRVDLKVPLNVKSCQLESFHIPLTWFNITSDISTFQINDGILQTLNIDPGRYNLLTLTQAMSIQLNSLTATYVISINSADQKINIADTGVGTFTLIYSAGGLFDILGLNPNQTLTGLGEYDFQYVPKLYSLENYLQLKIDYLEGAIEHIDNNQDATTFIVQLPDVLNKKFGERLECANLNNDENKIVFKTPVNVQRFRVQLYNSSNQLLDLNNNDYFFKLKIEE